MRHVSVAICRHDKHVSVAICLQDKLSPATCRRGMDAGEGSKGIHSLALCLCDNDGPNNQIRSLDSPAGLFVNHIRSLFDCDFVSLDPRINLRKYTIKNSFTLGSTGEANKVKILQSCNGLLLCTDYANVDSNVYGCAGLRLTFDPTKSPYYKVVRAGRTCSDTFIQVVLGGRKDDSFLVINLSRKVVEYNLISKNLREMYDMRSNQLTDDYHDGFILLD
nr:hypothetical protein [Tanacetum cinerariifolium]